MFSCITSIFTASTRVSKALPDIGKIEMIPALGGKLVTPKIMFRFTQEASGRVLPVVPVVAVHQSSIRDTVLRKVDGLLEDRYSS